VQYKGVKPYSQESVLRIALLLLAGAACPVAVAGDAGALFNEKCAGCHTIGGGNMVGPDLKASAQWSSGDLSRAVRNMEKNVGPLSDDEVDSLVAYLRGSKTQNQAVTSAPAKPVEAKVETASVERGALLFRGEVALQNGGLSCIACHSSGAGLGPNLSSVSTRMSESALASACEHTPYKVMKTAYKERAVTHQEALDIAAYLTSLNRKKEKEPPVVLGGMALALTTLVAIAIGYRNRNGGVRSKLSRRD